MHEPLKSDLRLKLERVLGGMDEIIVVIQTNEVATESQRAQRTCLHECLWAEIMDAIRDLPRSVRIEVPFNAPGYVCDFWRKYRDQYAAILSMLTPQDAPCSASG